MKRTVTVNKVGTGGVGLIVVFSRHPPVGCIDIKSDFSSYAQGYPDHNDNVFCTVWSRPFKDTKEAKRWISALTEEVKELASISDATIAQFTSLESVEDV